MTTSPAVALGRSSSLSVGWRLREDDGSSLRTGEPSGGYSSSKPEACSPRVLAALSGVPLGFSENRSLAGFGVRGGGVALTIGLEARGCGPVTSRLGGSLGSLGIGVSARGGAPALVGIGGGLTPVLVVFFARICSSNGTEDAAGVDWIGGGGGGGVPWIVVRGRPAAGANDPEAGGLASTISGRDAGGRPE